jgi:hypothetical protein
MLILASNTDLLQVITGNAGMVDVHASWMDNVAGAVVPGRTNTAGITTAGVTTVVGSPAVGVFRSVKTLHVFNRGNATATVTVVHTDGTTAVELHKVSLPKDSSLQYIDEIGFATTIAGVAGMSKLIAQRIITTAVKQVDFVEEISDIYSEYSLHILGVQVDTPGTSLVLRVSKNAGTTWEASPEQQYGHTYDVGGTNNTQVFHGGWDTSMWLSTFLAATTEDSFAINNWLIHTANLSRSGSRKLFIVDGMNHDPIAGPCRVTVGGTFWDDTHSNPPVNGLRLMLFPDGGPGKMTSGTFNLYGTRV